MIRYLLVSVFFFGCYDWNSLSSKYSSDGGAGDAKMYPSYCKDGVKDGDESDSDCGGSCPGCATGKACLFAKDCSDGVCSNNKCAAGSCTDMVKNGAETDVDCGGGTCPKCPTGKMCIFAADCLTGMCVNNTCKTSCSAGTDNCDGTGCNTNLNTDAANCGRCGNACPKATPFCISGMCTVGNKVNVGSYNVERGPNGNGGPNVYSCLETCAMLFGGQASDYFCSTDQNTINRKAFVDCVNDDTHCMGSPLADDYKTGGIYGCGMADCACSAYVQDHMTCANAVNWCFR